MLLKRNGFDLCNTMHLRIPQDSLANFFILRVLPCMIILCMTMNIAKCDTYDPLFHRAYYVIWQMFGNCTFRVILHYEMLIELQNIVVLQRMMERLSFFEAFHPS